jgi:hypothetical protein
MKSVKISMGKLIKICNYNNLKSFGNEATFIQMLRFIEKEIYCSSLGETVLAEPAYEGDKLTSNY